MHRCLAATHQGWPETLRQERVAQRSGIPDDENTIAMKAVMAIPDAQTTMLSLAGILGKAKVRQQLSKHSVAVQFIAADEAKLAIWRAQVAEVRSSLAQRQATGQARVSAIMQIIEKTAMIENMLAASMSPSMAAALDWSRGMQSRSIVP